MMPWRRKFGLPMGGVLLGVLMVLGPGPTHGGSLDPVLLGSVPGYDSGPVNAVVLQDTICYAACGEAGLFLVDVSKPTHPTLLSHLKLPGYATSIAVAGPYVYLAGTESEIGLRVVDVSRPSNPLEVARVPMEGGASGIAVSGHLAFLAGNRNAFRDVEVLVVDVATPANPRILARIAMGSVVVDMATVGDLLFLVRNPTVLVPGVPPVIKPMQGGDVQIFDCSNPSSPMLVGEYDMPRLASGIAATATHAYVVDGTDLDLVEHTGGRQHDATFSADDVVDLGSLAGRLKQPARVFDRWLAGSLSQETKTALATVDPSSSESEPLRGSLLRDLNLVLKGALIYEGTRFADIKLRLETQNLLGQQPQDESLQRLNRLLIEDAYPLELSREPGLLPRVGGVANLGASRIHVEGGMAYVSGSSGFRAVDVLDPARPLVWGTCDGGGDFSVGATVAAMAEGERGIQIIDLTDARAPVLAGNFVTSRFTRRVAVFGQHAFTVDWSAGLEVVDISNRHRPFRVGGIFQIGTDAVTLAAGWAYVGARDAIHAIDVSEPSEPRRASVFGSPGVIDDLTISGSRLYAAAEDAGLLTLDISNPAQPRFLNQLFLQGIGHRIKAAGSVIYASSFNLSGGGALQVIDGSDPTRPRVVGVYQVPNSPVGMELVGNHVLLGQSDRLEVIDVSDPTKPVLRGALATSGVVADIAWNGRHAFFTRSTQEGQAVAVVDLSDPANPRVVGNASNIGGEWFGLAASGAGLFVADGRRGLQILEMPSTLEIRRTTLPGNLEVRWDPSLAGAALFKTDHLDSPVWQEVSGVGSTREIAVSPGQGPGFYRLRLP
ncbi:MAG: hypothetical protein IT581_18140 [Verrucomicrobiales bacterium]|nr:hypothetical protein [Verrucomicrobiales bacterium]